MTKKSRRILDIINGQSEERLTLSSIQHYDVIEDIYGAYLQQHFFTVVNRIREYGEFLFFRDLVIYLIHKYKSDHAHLTYMDFIDLYFERFKI